jgi:hypothetical protein
MNKDRSNISDFESRLSASESGKFSNPHSAGENNHACGNTTQAYANKKPPIQSKNRRFQIPAACPGALCTGLGYFIPA